MVNHSRFQLVPWTDERDEIVALQINILGFIYLLLLERLDTAKYPLLANAKYRPGRIEILYPTSQSWVTFSWEDGLAHKALQVQFVQKVPREEGRT